MIATFIFTMVEVVMMAALEVVNLTVVVGVMMMDAQLHVIHQDVHLHAIVETAVGYAQTVDVLARVTVNVGEHVKVLA